MNEIAVTEKVVGSFLGAAVGDALGWPNEDRAHRVVRRHQPPAANGFLSWTRRRGWMAQTFEEPVLAGEYSDDTQLILATARSLRFDRWWERLAQVEFPTWLLYERGGGVAVKRAARAWASGKSPWGLAGERENYWNAGGNGVAMRILPHVARQIGANEFIEADDIVRNGILTHGHPRALVGAILYGFALRQCLRQTNTLSFGGLIDELLISRGAWGYFPEPPISGSWYDSVPGGLRDYKKLWDSVVDETTKLLKVARMRIDRGALEAGDEALREIGAFDRNTGGAGTVTASSAIFLASRYAASPKQGLRSAASMLGTDADTIASMTGALLGAIHGRECLNSLGASVQDAKYIERLAVESSKAPVSARTLTVSRKLLLQFTKELKSGDRGKALDLPDGRRATVDSRLPLFSRRVSAQQWRLTAEDGQTLIMSILERTATKTVSSSLSPTKVGVRLYVTDLKRAQDFYQTKLGLGLTSSHSNQLEFENFITISTTDMFQLRDEGGRGSTPRVLIYVDDIKFVYTRLASIGLHPSTIRRDSEGHACFCLMDPFGNELEVVGRYS